MTEEQATRLATWLGGKGYRCRPVNHYGKYGIKVYQGGSCRFLWTWDAARAYAG